MLGIILSHTCMDELSETTYILRIHCDGGDRGYSSRLERDSQRACKVIAP